MPCFISQGEGVAGPLRVIAHDVRSFHPGQVRCLLQHGANPNHTNYMQQSALHLAAVPGAHGSNPGPAGVACDHRPHAKALQGSRAGLPRSLAAPNPGCPSPWLSLTLAAPQPGRPSRVRASAVQLGGEP